MNYKEIIDNLQSDKVKQLLYELGTETVIEKDNCLITNTICHNISGGSLKLYYYFDTHLFYCYTSCEAMSIFKFLEKYYETRQIEFDWYNDIYKVVVDCSTSKKIDDFYIEKRVNLKEKYAKKEKPVLKKY